jgi:hypothetical protein
MSLFSKVSRFARSPQGKKAMDKAKDLASRPETKEKIEQAREKLSGKDKQQGAGAAQPAGQAEPTAPAAGGTPPANAQGEAAVGEQPPQGNPPRGA